VAPIRPFRPGLLARGGHRQTLLGFWHRRRLAWTPPTEDVVIDAEPGVQLLLRLSLRPDGAEAPLLVLVHGLGGWDAASYGLATGLLAWSRGWHVARMNMRGAGDSAPLSARIYNAGLDVDLLAVLQALAGRFSRIGLAGFSLGGSLALLTLGRQRERLPEQARALVAVSAPLDLLACVTALERLGNRGYQRYFIKNLRASYRYRQRLHPQLYTAGLEEHVRSVRDFDEAVTAPMGGFRDAADYYQQSSAGPWLPRIDRPTLVLNAADDPLIPVESVLRYPLPDSGLVRREILPTGGHVGFVAPTLAPGRFWAAERVMEFLEPAMGGALSAERRPATPAPDR
jgi:predicted alpha/beta-fold hydrolase